MSVDMSQVETILEQYPKSETSLVMILQDVQSSFNYLPCEVLERVADRLQLPHARVFSVATFYKLFSLSPQGNTIIQVCKGTACHIRGAQLLEDELCRQLEIPIGGTTSDKRFTIRTVNCVGTCAMAPVVIAGETYHPEVQLAQIGRIIKRCASPKPRTTDTLSETSRSHMRFDKVEDLRQRARALTGKREGFTYHLIVCGGPGCLAAGARQIKEALFKQAKARELPVVLSLSDCQHHEGSSWRVTLSGCQGLCQQGPLVHVLPDDLLYPQVQLDHVGPILDSLERGKALEILFGESAHRYSDHPFYKQQVLRALSTCGRVDPTELDDYLAVGGFSALAYALEKLDPMEIISAVEDSGLRGRGGAGFSTGRKWRSAVRAASKAGRPPYLLCNGDEGDPGAFMDRAIMEGSPFQVLEGMILGAYAIGAVTGYIYVRAEYPLAVERLENAIQSCRESGLLGQQILGQPFDFEIQISRGGGAFVCGESTALIRSIEGQVGEPRAKYVRSVERGLYDSPTVLNNVETWALVPQIVLEGPERFAALGTTKSKGTKAFSLTGNVRRTGLVEVPMGTSLRQLIFEIGGGIADGRSFKAVQTGGPSGGCLPESQLDLPVDFEALEKAGSMMGSGGMIVMDDQTCMVDVARYFVDFLLEESCGKCTACRLGLPQLSFLLGRLTRGQGSLGDLETIKEVATTMAENSLCGLGKSAPNPVTSTLKYFQEEYQAHLEGRCPAGVCRELISYHITADCPGCLLCIKPCPTSAIIGSRDKPHLIDQKLCTKCGICKSICQHNCIDVVSREITHED